MLSVLLRRLHRLILASLYRFEQTDQVEAADIDPAYFEQPDERFRRLEGGVLQASDLGAMR